MCRFTTLVLVCAGILCAQTKPVPILTVSPDGPMSLAAARDELRKAEPAVMKRIVVRGGKYFLTETLLLDQRDSGWWWRPIPVRSPFCTAAAASPTGNRTAAGSGGQSCQA
jgi:hypothetical protein